MLFNHPSRYMKVPEEEEALGTKHLSAFRSKLSHIGLFIACFSIGILGFFSARTVSSLEYNTHHLQLNTITHTFHYNRSFSYPPSNHTNHAWRQIFPAEGGFFVHPTIAPTRSTFSVFHQLHCLNAIRGGYWASHHAAVNGIRLADDDLPVDVQESHIRHCIDLIRQSLMCMADTTLEVVDEAINGVHGFRTPHQCKDWEQLKLWTSEQQERQHVEQIV